MLPPRLKRLARRVAGERALSPTEKEWLRLSRTPRYERVTTNVMGADLIIPDCASFLAMYAEIFENSIYRFRTDSAHPFIVDCGANIGMSAIYFHRNYPSASILAFEADPDIFDILKCNLDAFGASNVKAMNRAIWDEDTTLTFATEGADAGHALRNGEDAATVKIDAIRLSPYLEDRTVDFLKMDIEGAEMRVLTECAPNLAHVRNLFVEYHSFPNEEQQLAELCALLRDAGFRIYVQGVHGAIPRQPLYDPPPGSGSDLQLNIWAYRAPGS